MEEFFTAPLKRFNYLTSEIDTAYHEAALKLGLSDSAMLILYTICNYGEQCLLSDICRLSGTSKQTINSALRKLEAEGFIYLKTAAGRRKLVCLTDSGKVMVKNTVMRLIEIENDIFGAWSEQEQEQYLELTQRYLTSFKKKIKEI